MSNEKNLELMGSFKELEAFVQEAKRLLVVENHDYNSLELYTAISDITYQAQSIQNKLDDLDENMDIELTNIPNIDNLFEGNPVTDYVNARVEYALGNDSQENVKRMLEAANEINDMTVYEDEDEVDLDCETDCTRETCTCFPDQTLYEYVTSVDEAMTEEINNMMDIIDIEFTNQDVFEGEDVELLRFYLSHLPMNSKTEVDVMSDRQVVLAYKQRQLAQNKL